VAVAVAEPAAPAGVELDLSAFVALWPAVLEHVEGTLLARMLHDARPVSLADGEVTVALTALAKRRAETPANQQVIAEAIRAVTGSSLRLAYALRDDDAAPVGAPALSDDELVARFKAEFDAEELPPEPPESEETS
jgi:DNA polymerase-3 subunit gamma/tau